MISGILSQTKASTSRFFQSVQNQIKTYGRAINIKKTPQLKNKGGIFMNSIVMMARKKQIISKIDKILEFPSKYKKSVLLLGWKMDEIIDYIQSRTN